MSPDEFRAWVRVLRDVVIVAVGAFMLVTQVYADSPNPYLIGAGLAALGLPPAFRLDEKRKGSSVDLEDDNERWSHLP